MPTRLHLTRETEFSGTLPFGAAPGGELTFADGVTTVPDEDPLNWLGRYPALEVVNDDDAPETDTETETEADADPFAEADVPFDPRAHTVAEIRDALDEYDLSDAQRRDLAEIERAGDRRTTALEAIDAPPAPTASESETEE